MDKRATNEQTPPIPRRISILRANCLVLYRLWWAIHYTVGLVGVIAGGVAGISASNEASTIKAWGWAIGAIAAVCTSLVTFLGPLQKAERYWKAYHSLDQACLEYEYQHSSLNNLIAEAKRVRAMVVGSATENANGREEANQRADY